MRSAFPILVLLLLFAPTARPQSKTAAPPKLSDRAVVLRSRIPNVRDGTQGDRAESLQLSDKAVAEIRTLQLRQAQLTIQAQQLLAQYQTQREQLDAEIRSAEEKALKDAGADPGKYQINDQSLAIEPVVPRSARDGKGIEQRK